MLIDIHTHAPKRRQGALSVHVLDVATDAGPSADWRYFCVGLHPWNAQAGAFPSQAEAFARLEKWARAPQCLMVGESGLDKIKGADGPAWQLQRDWCQHHLKLAQELGKPIVLHCVRAYQQMLALLKEARYTGPVLFHDYNGGPEDTRALLKAADCYFSYGQTLFRAKSKGLDSLALVPVERLFLETDDSGRDIQEVYEKIPKGREVDFEGNFKRLFGSVGTP